MKSKVFVWDWDEIPPVAAIVKAAASIKGARAWYSTEGGDTYILIVARDKATARRGFKRFWKGGASSSEILSWVDGYET